MTSEKQAKANRRNALKSTGPKSQEGKAIVRHNATQHSLLSREVLLPGEDAEALKELDETLRAELQPVGALENLLVDRMVAALWSLRRLDRVEASIFAYEMYGEMAERAQKEADTYERGLMDGLLAADITVTDEHKHQEALSKAKEMQAA